MPDIFGKEREDYSFARHLSSHELWDRYEQSNAQRQPYAAPRHNFVALGQGVPEAFKRAADNAQALGYLTDNLLALQTMADEILYTAYRLPMFVSINTNIGEGARSYGVRVMDRVGRATRVTAPGYEAQSASVSETLVTKDLHLYGLDAEWSVDELRGAMEAGTALDTESIDAAVTGTMETMEAVGLTGGEYGDVGLLNIDAATEPDENQASLQILGDGQGFADLPADEIRTVINDELSKVIEESSETLGRNINTGMTVYLPGKKYDMLTSKYIGDNAERTVMRSIIEDNPWTHFTNGSPVMIERVLELGGIGTGGMDRMVVCLKHERIAEMGVSIMPRVLRILDKGRVICAQVEAKFSPLFVKRPNNIYYTDGI